MCSDHQAQGNSPLPEFLQWHPVVPVCFWNRCPLMWPDFSSLSPHPHSHCVSPESAAEGWGSFQNRCWGTQGAAEEGEGGQCMSRSPLEQHLILLQFLWLKCGFYYPCGFRQSWYECKWVGTQNSWSPYCLKWGGDMCSSCGCSRQHTHNPLRGCTFWILMISVTHLLFLHFHI